MPNYTYVCEQGHRTEAKGEYEDSSAPCTTCGAPAHRQPFYDPPTVLSPSGRLDPGHDRSQERFLDRAPYLNEAYERGEREVGGHIRRPKWYGAGVARARVRAIQADNQKQLQEVCDLAKKADATRHTD